MSPALLAPSVPPVVGERPPRLALVRRDGCSPVPVRVVLAAGQPVVRAGLRVFLEREQRITVVGEAATGEDALSLALGMRRGVVVIDTALPGLDGEEVARRIRARSGVAVLLVSAWDAAPSDLVRAVLRCGREYRRPTVTEIPRSSARTDLRLVTPMEA